MRSQAPARPKALQFWRGPIDGTHPSAQDDRSPRVFEPLGQLGARGRLARAVDPRDQVNTGALGGDSQRSGTGVLKQTLELFLDERRQVLVGCLLVVGV